VLYVPDADCEPLVMESPKSAPPCLESGSFTESVETIRSSSVSHVSQVRVGKGEGEGRKKVGTRRGEGEGEVLLTVLKKGAQETDHDCRV